MQPNKIELGCGNHKRPGFFGIDSQPGPSVDLVLDIEREKLPFEDDSINYIYSSHTFEHLEAPGSPIQTLREMMRVAKHGSVFEIWTPYGKSNDALLFGHRNFYTETHWQHIIYLYDDFYFGNSPGRLIWEKTQYVIYPNIIDTLATMNISIEFAIMHMYNIAMEFGVFLRVDKHAKTATKPQYPVSEFCYARGNVISVPPQRHLIFRNPYYLCQKILKSLRDKYMASRSR